MLDLDDHELKLAADVCRHFVDSRRHIRDPYASDRVDELRDKLLAELARRRGLRIVDGAPPRNM